MQYNPNIIGAPFFQFFLYLFFVFFRPPVEADFIARIVGVPHLNEGSCFNCFNEYEKHVCEWFSRMVSDDCARDRCLGNLHLPIAAIELYRSHWREDPLSRMHRFDGFLFSEGGRVTKKAYQLLLSGEELSITALQDEWRDYPHHNLFFYDPQGTFKWLPILFLRNAYLHVDVKIKLVTCTSHLSSTSLDFVMMACLHLEHEEKESETITKRVIKKNSLIQLL